MLKKSMLTVAFLLSSIGVSPARSADVPMLLNYQGNLTDPAGAAKNGTFSMQFAVYDAETGGNQLPSGTPWSETQSVTVNNGVFNVLLGSVTALPTSLFQGGPSDARGPMRYLQVVVDGEALAPRRRIVSVPYAIQASAGSLASMVLRGYLYGLITANAGSDAMNDLTIGAGAAADDTNSYLINLTSAITKQGDAAFGAGDNAGGGSITGAPGKRYIYLIGKTTDALAADVTFSTMTSPTLPNGWDIKRLIGYRYWDGSRWAVHTTIGTGPDKKVQLMAAIQLKDNIVVGSTFTDVDCSAYLDGSITHQAKVTMVAASAGNTRIYYRPKGSSESANDRTVFASSVARAEAITGAIGDVLLDANAVFQWAASDGFTSGTDIWLRGYEEEL